MTMRPASALRPLTRSLLGLVALTLLATPLLLGADDTSCAPSPIEPVPVGCVDNNECTDGEYCAMDGCDAALGTCTLRPEACDLIWAPVCGCDGETYSDACFAAAAGVNVAAAGACPVARCWANTMCELGEYCLYDGCAAETGRCARRPRTCRDGWSPVCGCDGITYSNDCYAALAGVTVDHEGECRGTETP